MAGLAELGHAEGDYLLHGFAGGLHVVARVELLGLGPEDLADCAGHGEAVVGVDVDFADAVADAELNLFDRHAPGFLQLAAVLVDDVLEFLGYRGAAVHDEVGVGQALVDGDEDVHLEDGAVGLFGELVCAVAGADGDSEGVDAGLLGKLDGLVRVSDVLEACAACSVAVFNAAEDADFAFDRDAALVGVVDDFAGDFDVLFKGGRGLAVFLEGAVHHDRGVAEFDGALTGFEAVAVILMHGDGDLGIELGGGLDELEEVKVLGELAGAAAGLDDDGRPGFLGRRHDGLDLFHIVDVECADAVTALGGLVE